MKLASPTKLITAASLLGLAAADSPWFCHENDCPLFTNSSEGGTEVRIYEAAYWTSTNVSSTSLDEASSIGFHRLFDYISGENDSGGAIDMTSPVLNQVIPGAGPNCNSTFIVSFYAPFAYQADPGPPQPTSPDVYVQKLPAMQVAVSEFGGFANQKVVIAEAAALETEVSFLPSLANLPAPLTNLPCLR